MNTKKKQQLSCGGSVVAGWGSNSILDCSRGGSEHRQWGSRFKEGVTENNLTLFPKGTHDVAVGITYTKGCL